MHKQYSIVDLLSNIQKTVFNNTGIKVYDTPPKDASAPFFIVEVLNVTPENTKTMYVMRYSIRIHAVAEGGSSVDVLELVKSLEEALTEDLNIPEPWNFIRQDYQGLRSILTDETGEKRAITEWAFLISYGYMCK